jgi:hypothetical protein
MNEETLNPLSYQQTQPNHSVQQAQEEEAAKLLDYYGLATEYGRLLEVTTDSEERKELNLMVRLMTAHFFKALRMVLIKCEKCAKKQDAAKYLEVLDTLKNQKISTLAEANKMAELANYGYNLWEENKNQISELMKSYTIDNGV